jgi:hypothetical protein
MTAPALAAYYTGKGQVSDDNLNTFMQTCNIASDLRGFAGTIGIAVYMRGFSAIGDGGQGVFYWNASSTAADDGGVSTVVPSGSTSGAWNRITILPVMSYSLQVPISGFSITIGNGVNQLILNPAGTLATGTVTMPLVALDGQTVRISSEQTITSLTVSANTNQTVVGAPTTLAQYASALFMYKLSTLTWYRV